MIWIKQLKNLKMTTIKQKQAIKKMVENGGNASKAMRDVKYSKNTAKTPKKLTESKGYKKETKPILEQYEKELQAILTAMKLKNKKSEQYQVLVKAADTIQKQIQLLGGQPTENKTITVLDKKEQEKVDEILGDV